MPSTQVGPILTWISNSRCAERTVGPSSGSDGGGGAVVVGDGVVVAGGGAVVGGGGEGAWSNVQNTTAIQSTPPESRNWPVPIAFQPG